MTLLIGGRLLTCSLVKAWSLPSPLLASTPKKSLRMMSTSATEDLLVKMVDNQKMLITLNRAKVLNSLTIPMVKSMLSTLKTTQSSLVVVEGAGDKAFCAGGDIRSITDRPKEARGAPEQAEFFELEYRLDYLTATIPAPYVALIDGFTMGGGVGISAHGRYRVATERTVFAMPETGIGLFPDVGGSYFLPRLRRGPQLGLFLGLTGHRLKGTDCLHAGIATHMCRSDHLPELKEALLGLATSGDVDGHVRSVLEDFDAKFGDKGAFSLLKVEPEIKRCFGFEGPTNRLTAEEIVGRLQECLDRPDQSEWAAKTLKSLNSASPTSLKVSLEQLRRGQFELSSLKECLEMEFRVVNRCLAAGDFYEGVRALLIDRDNSPQWSPASLAEVTEESVKKYFDPLPHELVLA